MKGNYPTRTPLDPIAQVGVAFFGTDPEHAAAEMKTEERAERLDEILNPPEDFIERHPWCDDLGLSNFSHEIPEGTDAVLKEGQIVTHAAWNFNGKVWWRDGRYYETVSCYRAQVATFAADSLETLYATVNDAYGWE